MEFTNLSKISYHQVLARLDDLDAWLKKLDIPLKNDRIHWAIERLRLGTAAKRTENLPKGIPIGEFYVAYTDALEMYDIFRAFEHEPAQILAPKLLRILSGPRLPLAETNSNADARNTMFEMALAAEWKLHGFDVSLGEPDVTLRIGDIRCIIECKRPYSEHSIRANVKGAARQLKSTLTNSNASSQIGMIAISASRIFNRGDRLFISDTVEGVQALQNALRKLIDEYKHSWRDRDFHPGISAILFHVASPSKLLGSISLAQSIVISQVGTNSPLYKKLTEQLGQLYAS